MLSRDRRECVFLPCCFVLACSHVVHHLPVAPLTLTSDAGREQPPPALAVREHAPAALESFVLPNGMRVIAVERGALPIVAVRYVALDAGSEHASAAQVALPELTARALVSGGTRLAGGDMRDLEIGGVRIEPQVDETFTSLQFRVGSEGLGLAIAKLASTVRAPLFAELEPSRADVERDVAGDWDRVSRLADRLLQQLLFGTQDRRAVQPRRWLQRLHEQDAAALRAWYARYTPARSALVVAGRFDPAELRRAALGAFGDWVATAPVVDMQRTSMAPSFGDHVLSCRAALSMITVAYPTVASNHPDYWNTQLLAQALGSTPTTAAWLALRHRSGLSYHVSSSLRATRADGQLVVTTAVVSDALGAAVALLLDTATRFATRGLTQPELDAAKRGVRDELELRFESNARVAEALSSWLVFGDPVETLPRMRAQVAATTLAAVNGSARRYLASNRRVLLVVGPHLPSDSRIRSLEGPTFFTLEGLD